MKIVTKLKLFGVVATLLLIVAGVIFYWRSVEVQTVTQKTDIANEIIGGAFKTNILSADYVVSRGERAQTQWKLQQNILVKSIASYPADRPDEQKAINEIKKWQEISLTHFNQLVEATGAQESSKPAVPLSGEAEKRLIAQLSIDEQNIVTAVTTLVKINNAQLVSVRQSTGLIFMATIVLLGMSIIFGYFSLVVSISEPIRQLDEGARIIAEGNLDFKLDVDHRRDEFGALTVSFNTMVAKLKVYLERLEVSKARIEAILQNMGDGVVTVDANGKIILVNNTTCEILDFSRSDLEGKSLMDAIVAKDHGVVVTTRRPYYQALTSGITISSGELTFVKKDGSDLAVFATASPLILDGVVSGVTIVFRDFSKEKKIDIAKSEFVGLASHQLRTPLSKFKWNMEILLSGDLGQLTKAQKEYIETSLSTSRGMIELVNMFLDINRMELGTLQTKPQEVNMAEILKSSFGKFRADASDKKIEISEEYEIEIATIKTDPGLLITVLENLFSNAVKYTPDNGKISVLTRKSDNDLKISVSDTGLGIPKNQQDKIFTKLFRADNVKSIDPNGRGLGLYIAKTIMTLLGGKIWFESTEGVGTTFYLTLPLA